MSHTNDDDKHDIVDTNSNPIIDNDIGDTQNQIHHNTTEMTSNTGVIEADTTATLSEIVLSNNHNHLTAADTSNVETNNTLSVENNNNNTNNNDEDDDGIKDAIPHNDTDDMDNDDDLCNDYGGITSLPTGTTPDTTNTENNNNNNHNADIPIWKENRFQFINLPRNESIHRAIGRQSTVSSMAGNSIEYDDDNINTNNTNSILNPSNGTLHDITDDDDHNQQIVVNTTDLPFRMDNNHNITTAAAASSTLSIRSNTQYNNNCDERSIRSESTRPDPPSSIMNEKDHDEHDHILPMEKDDDDNNINNNNKQNQQKQKQQHRHVTTAEENFAVEALASLSTNMAEMTLLETDTNMNTNINTNNINPTFDSVNNNNNTIDVSMSSRYPSDWDLHRDALLAETPEVTVRKIPSMGQIDNNTNINHNNTIEENDHHDNTSVSGLGYHRTSSFTRVYIPNPNNTSSTNTTTTTTGADHLMVLPRVDEHRFYNHTGIDDGTQLSNGGTMNMNPNIPQSIGYGYNTHHSNIPPPPPTTNPNNVNMGVNIRSVSSGRRKIRLRLQEEIRNTNSTKRRHLRTTSLLGTIRRSSTRMLRFGNTPPTQSSLYDDTDDIDTSLPAQLYTTVDRGTVNVGWFDGTSSLDLQQHIRSSVLRKLQLLDNTITDLDDIRILDESVNPPEDVVLSPYIPDGSQFLLRFGTIKSSKSKNDSRTKTDFYDGTMTPMSIYSGRAPDSPSAAPSPHLEKALLMNGLNANQIALLNSLNISTNDKRLLASNRNQIDKEVKSSRRRSTVVSNIQSEGGTNANIEPSQGATQSGEEENEESKNVDSKGVLLSEESSDDDADAMMLHSDDPIEARLREITNLLLLDRKRERNRRYDRQHEKRQVVFVVANYFVLFLAIIAISAELQARAPNWIKMMEEHLQNVQNCSENQEALFECVSRGDFAGLIASVVLWLSRSVTTKRIFLFGFDTPKKLWTVVYESLVTSVCWGVSYLFIRRGMNPDTRPRFVQKYWKDAVYGSLAGFNAAFLKHILKNLIPEQVVEDALRERQLKIMGWLPSFNFR